MTEHPDLISMTGGPQIDRGSGPVGPAYVEAFAYAAEVHHDQLRKGTHVAYISHVMSVSALVLEDGGTETEAIGGLLHDTIEDGPSDAEAQLRARFGPEVLAIVQACSDSGFSEPGRKEPWITRKERYVGHLESASPSALRVTAADKLHNSRCTVDDLRITPVWPQSNACVHQHLWYYATISDVVSRRLPDSRTATELDRTVDDLCQLAGAPRPAPSLHAPRCDVCPDAAT